MKNVKLESSKKKNEFFIEKVKQRDRLGSNRVLKSKSNVFRFSCRESENYLKRKLAMKN